MAAPRLRKKRKGNEPTVDVAGSPGTPASIQNGIQ
jgi:hypothetical protein